MDIVKRNQKLQKIERDDLRKSKSLKRGIKKPLRQELREELALKSRIINKLDNNKKLTQKEKNLYFLKSEKLIREEYKKLLPLQKSIFLTSLKTLQNVKAEQRTRKYLEIVKKYNVNETYVKELESEGLLKTYRKSEISEANTLIRNQNTSLLEERKNTLPILRLNTSYRRVFKYLGDLNRKNLDRESCLKLAQEYNVSENDFKKLEINGVINTLGAKDRKELLLSLGSEVKNKKEVPLKYLDRVTFKKKITPIGFNEKILPKRLVNTANEYLMSGMKKSFLEKNIPSEKDRNLVLKSLVLNETFLIEEVDIYTNLNLSNMVSHVPEPIIYDSIETLKKRSHQEDIIDLKLNQENLKIFNKYNLNIDLSKKEELLLLETNADLLTNKHIISNRELLLIQKTQERKNLTKKTLFKIASEDFSITNERVGELFEIGVFSELDEFVSVEYREDRSMLEKRTLEGLKMTTPLSVKHVGPTYLDYKIIESSALGKELSFHEKQRSDQLAMSGIDVSSKEFYNSRLKDIKAQKLLLYRKNLLLKLYKHKFGVNRELLKFVNKFKQVSEKSMISMGITKKELSQLCGESMKGDPLFDGVALLKLNSYRTREGNVRYFSINHEGDISGRRFLEEELEKKHINKRPQGRKDLIPHDLKVVDCVIEVIREVRDRGGKILKISNESMQYRDQKTGKLNHEREDTPGFLDAIIHIEQEGDAPYMQLRSGSGKSQLKIGIEYGNYPTIVMGKKLETAEYDYAYIYSNEQHKTAYEAKLGHFKNVEFRTM